MPTGTLSERIPASSADVFALLHDYPRRLEWDTLLRAAHLEPAYPQAALGAISVCAGKWHLGGLALRTKYVAFHPPLLAAVQMLNRPLFFESFAASIRHEDLSPTESSITYRFTFQSRPRWLRFLLHPLMAWIFRWETGKRLRALRKFLETKRAGSVGAAPAT